MARPQSELQELLEEKTDAVMVAFQPKSGLEYPCIVYERGQASSVKFADNKKYLLKKGYTVTVITREPDSPIPDQVEDLPDCRFDRFFKREGLNHFVFQLFF